MFMKQTTVIIFIAILLICFICVPAGAVMLEYTVKGPVSTINRDRNTLTVDYPLRYGCSYPGRGSTGLFLYTYQ